MNATDELLKTARSYEPMQVFSLIAELTKIAFHNRVFGSTFPLRDSTGSVVGYLAPPVQPASISPTSWNEPEEVMAAVVHGYANTEGSTDFADVMNRLRSTTQPTSSSTPSLS